jgi:DNA-binding transcriptional LysR family regulator
VDLIAACRVLIEVESRGSVTRAAAALGVAQSVASRRLMALEQRLGAPVLERSGQRASLTPFGRDVVPSAVRLVRLADQFELDAERALLQPITVLVPLSCSVRDLAVAVAAGRAAGVGIQFERETPARRAERTAALSARVAVTAVPETEARWRVPLGAGSRARRDDPLRLDALRRGRTARRSSDDDAGSRLRIGPEDDVPHVRDVITRAGFSAGLVPGQLPIDASTTTALAEVLAAGDLLLCSESEAAELGLHWRPFADLPLSRGYALTAGSEHDARQIADVIGEELAACLGAMPGAVPGDGPGER